MADLNKCNNILCYTENINNQKRIKELEEQNEILHSINRIQAERLAQWQDKLEAKELDKELRELYEQIIEET